VEVIHLLSPGRRAWLQVARGEVHVEGRALRAGDGAAITDVEQIAVRAGTDAELLLFDLA
jgi:redox-sensitive bicupin YhaK (pirin superfamily)